MMVLIVDGNGTECECGVVTLLTPRPELRNIIFLHIPVCQYKRKVNLINFKKPFTALTVLRRPLHPRCRVKKNCHQLSPNPYNTTTVGCFPQFDDQKIAQRLPPGPMYRTGLWPVAISGPILRFMPTNF